MVWVALKDPEPAEVERLQEEFNLHELEKVDDDDQSSDIDY